MNAVGVEEFGGDASARSESRMRRGGSGFDDKLREVSTTLMTTVSNSNEESMESTNDGFY